MVVHVPIVWHGPPPSPPVLRGRALGGEGSHRVSCSSPSPCPLPRSTGGEGVDSVTTRRGLRPRDFLHGDESLHFLRHAVEDGVPVAVAGLPEQAQARIPGAVLSV